MFANVGDGAADAGYWINATVEPDGRFTITNVRNGFRMTYRAR
jgi:hypothetical protein